MDRFMEVTMRILLAEDEKNLNDIIVKTLKKEHYTIDACFNGEEALDYLRFAEYDAILLDIMMPQKSGLEVLKVLRKEGNNVPVLLLTAKDNIEDRVKGLDAGADDYLVKPFAIDELLARIRALLRRGSGRQDHRYSIANLVVDTDARTVYRDEKEISLSSKEFSILEYMICNQGIVLTRDKIEQHIWNYEYEGASNVVDVYIRYLTKKIDDNYSPKLIHTIRGTGYVLKE